ncbi:hypothetical protein EU527_10520 [Candidatus Thorarchaeota archaeon]|nr:MAG: hypothetical protein EU527_10520 [Candidatus Thorarchaeota archaeon]
MELQQIVKSVVSNLHQSYLSHDLSQWYEIDSLQIREDLIISSYSEASANPSDLYEEVRKYIFSKTFQQEEIVEFLLNVPKWAGFHVDMTIFETEEQAITAAKHSAISTIWLMALPRILISHITSPQEFEEQGVDILVKNILQSDTSRSELNDALFREFSNRGLDIGHFSVSGVVQGYAIKGSNRLQRMQTVLALIMMKASNFPFDLDSVFNLDEDSIIEETTAYIIAMHTKRALSDRITGTRSSRPFDWPLIGTIRVFSELIDILNILMKYAAKITTCSLFATTTKGKRVTWTEEEFISFLVHEIAENYNTALRSSGKGKNEELARFIDLLNGENIDITSRVMESKDKASALYEEFLECKRRARVGEKPQITPERRFRVIFSTLKQRIAKSSIEEVSSEEMIDQIAEIFEAIEDIIQKHKDILGNEVDKFTEELCFETSFRILELLDLGDTLVNLPWVSRFVAEESALRDISDGDIRVFREEQRIQRIISAYAGGVVYLILQS